MRYVFSNLGQGLRRNLSMHLAVILTLFVSLALVGAGVLVKRQADAAAEQWGNELQITAFLCREDDPVKRCLGAVDSAQKAAITKVVKNNPEVASFYFESQETAYQKAQKLFDPKLFQGDQPVLTPADFRESIWITLKNPDQFQGITSAVLGLDGVSSVKDQRDVVQPILSGMRVMQVASLGVAVFLVVAALMLVANTIRLAAFARRKEIAIMRLVGASGLYISLPFLLEALFTAIVGVALAGGALAAGMWFGVHDRLRDYIGFIPWIGLDDFLVALVIIAIVGPVVTLLPTLLLTRKYIKV
ncbi:permease-like cell division protein FtsX [Nocardioides sp. TRM66260-LWL]|uniref:permease-like cell division protein FtsX n=1 Tax=Nocardioides sp. TRM66260-LWL TaxID=2874478 RepID=UPI001CC57731|nr:permease-like cell division protein FtsX [Nocardioides sp. TRM66260-LWL]MBZ5732909.1 permease-like cell division protein FtsX [Nocardioides sp. TRM66260-LWL]